MVIDGCTMFNCRHEFVALPFGFACHKCEHQRPELEITGPKSLLFFPMSRWADQDWQDGAVAMQAYLLASAQVSP